MKTIALAALVFFTVSCTTTEPSETWSQKMIESHGLGDFYCNRHYQETLVETGWDYVAGLVANAVLKGWQAYPEKGEYYEAVKAYADRNTAPDGSMILKSNGTSALGPSNIDDLAAGKIYFALYEEELKRGNKADAERYKNAVTVIRNTLKYNHSRIAEGLPGAGGFFHKAIYPNQMWLDGLYMGPAVYAQWQSVFGPENPQDNQESWSDIAHQFKTLHRYTWDSEKELNYHAWSAEPTDSNSFWANPAKPMMGCSKEFWGRGMGWYFAALVDVLELMPTNHPDYAALLANCRQVAAGLKRWQDSESGVWYQLLQYDARTTADGIGDTVDGETFNVGTLPNYLEASASCMFTYAYLKGIRLGLLDRATFQPVADKAFQGILDTFIREQEDGSLDIVQTCASAGLGPAKNPSRTGTINYYLVGRDVTVVENEGKAIGTFIMAAIEKEIAGL
ncbi:MAG: glycoside hydrolase family 88 protein [Rikenellaceae bacterium]|nr:glycoside hydrolase family 88 protein [Rikenellaceae bacterium]